MNETGAHTSGYNRSSIGICFVGNFDEDKVPTEQWKLGLKLIRSLCEILSIPVEKVYSHHNFANYKSCPGLNFNMEAFKNQLRKGGE